MGRRGEGRWGQEKEGRDDRGREREGRGRTKSGERREGKRKGNLAPTVISKSRHLCIVINYVVVVVAVTSSHWSTNNIVARRVTASSRQQSPSITRMKVTYFRSRSTRANARISLYAVVDKNLHFNFTITLVNVNQFQ